MAKLKWTKKSQSLLGSDYDDDGFKERVEKNQEGAKEAEMEQAYFFRRYDIFNEITPEGYTKTYLRFPQYTKYMVQKNNRVSFMGTAVGVHSTAAPARTIPDVMDFYNFDRNGGFANLPILPHIRKDDQERNKMYCRAGWPSSSKQTWKRLGNNFRILKITTKKKDKLKADSGSEKSSTIVFPKSINNQPTAKIGRKTSEANKFQDTIFSFTGIDVEFEGTYRETARSDVLVKIRFTMNSFDILERYYDSNGLEQIIDDVDTTKHLRLLDLFTPADIEETNQGIILELYTNRPDDERSFRNSVDGQPDKNNYLKLNLFIVDHTMTFDETTNKIDVEIEYRAAADMEIMSEAYSEKNLLYDGTSRDKLKRIILRSRELMQNGCYDKSAEELDKLADIPKQSANQILGGLLWQFMRDGTVRTWMDDPDFENRGYIKNYDYDATARGGVLAQFDYDDIEYHVSDSDWSIHSGLVDANLKQEMRRYHFVSLRNLLNDFIPVKYNAVDYYKVLLPFVAWPLSYEDVIARVEGDGFFLGDLPIAVELFEKWYNSKYIEENIIYLDFKTFVKDVILNYVNPALKLAWYDHPEIIKLGASSFDLIGKMKLDPNTSQKLKQPRVFTEDWDDYRYRFVPTIPEDDVQVVPYNNSDPAGSNFGDDHGEKYVFISVYVEQGGDFLAGQLDAAKNIAEKIKIISDHYLVIEGKSPYGPFKTLKLAKNDSDYLREIRLEKQGKTDISQLGAVYDATLETYPNCPDFRFFPGDYCFLYVPDFGLSMDKDNLAYKLGVGGHQIVTKVSHKIELEGHAKMTTKVTMRFWNHGIANKHNDRTTDTECDDSNISIDPVDVEIDADGGWVNPEG